MADTETTLGPYAQEGYNVAVLVHSYGSGCHWYLHNVHNQTYRPANAEENNGLNSTGMINGEVFASYDARILPPGVNLGYTFSVEEMKKMCSTGIIPQEALNSSVSPAGIYAVEDIGGAPDYVAFGEIYTGMISMPYRYDGKFKKYAPNTGKELDSYTGGSTQRAGSIGGTFRFDLPEGVNLTLEFTKELLEQIISTGNIPDNYKMHGTELLRIKMFNRSSTFTEKKGIAMGETATQPATPASTTSGILAAKQEANKKAHSVIASQG